jgi:AcrR family transcriptional regulator
MAMTSAKPRRTQEERRAATQTALLEATIDCLGQYGYASTSISSIIEKAGVSRGALLHHYPSKNELIAHAIVYFYRQRLSRFKKQLLGADTSQLSLEDRLRVLKDDFETWYHTALEIEVAMRTNDEIAKLETSFSATDREEMSREYESLFPEFAETDSPRELVGVACYLMRGIASSDNPENTARQFDISVSLIRAYLENAQD